MIIAIKELKAIRFLWINGTVYLENGKTYKDIPLKYDVYQNELLARMRGQAIYITRNIINSFVLQPDSLDHEIKFTNDLIYIFKKAASLQ